MARRAHRDPVFLGPGQQIASHFPAQRPQPIEQLVAELLSPVHPARSYSKPVEILGVPACGGALPRPNLFTLRELLDFEAQREYLVTNFAHGNGGFSGDYRSERGPVKKFFLGGFGP